MTETFVPIPVWNGATGNWKPGRIYYNGPRFGQSAELTGVVVHWADGTQDSTDRTFQNPNRVASAHASFEEDNLHVYVESKNTAFHSGNGVLNCETIGGEFSAEPGRDATDATYETGCQYFVREIHRNGKKVSQMRFYRHGEIIPTACCGTVDVNRVRNRCLEIENAGAILPNLIFPISAPIKIPVIEEFMPFMTDLSPSQEYREEVKRMQKYLEIKGHFFTDQGNNDGYYGAVTQRAVHDFQGAHGILNTTQYGWWYPLTRAAANRDLSIPQTTNT